MKFSGYEIVNDILNEGRISRYLVDLSGRGTAGIAKKLGVTSRSHAQLQKDIANKTADMLNQNVKVGSPSRFGRSFEKSLKTEPLTKAGNI